MHWLLGAQVLAFAGFAFGNSGKLDGKLQSEVTTELRESNNRRVLGLRASTVGRSVTKLSALVHLGNGGLDDLRAKGVEVQSVLGDVATVTIARDKLSDLAALPSIKRMVAARRPALKLDQSVAVTHASLLRQGVNPVNWVGGTGNGVLVGLVDTGLDLAHPDFRGPDGASRVLYYWNQRDDAVGNAPSGEAGTALYGAECDNAMITQALKGNASLARCKVIDSYGHGTHVAGIAAGNGQASGNGQPSYRYVGMAPMADLIVANALDAGVNQKNAVVDAVAYMVRKAKALNRPIVINLSFGSYYGPRDGTSPLERALDNASGPGVIIVAAVGNEGDKPIRASGPIDQGQTAAIAFTLPAFSRAQAIEGWYDGANQYDVQLVCGNFSTPVIAAGDNYHADTPCGVLDVTSTEPNPSNADRQIYIAFGDGLATIPAGAWVLNLVAREVRGQGSFSFISGETQSDITFTNYLGAPYTTEIITDTASAGRAIAVAAYNTRNSWNWEKGVTTRNDAGEMGTLSTFSSRGPRRMCSNAALCPPVMKPEITAPGAYVVSAYTSARELVKPLNFVEADGVHVANSGTSMAAAHVTGTVALLLQANPLLTPEDAKRHLASSVQAIAPAATAPLPLYEWGYGVVDAAAAFRLATGYRVGPGWNLLGNTLDTTMQVADLAADAVSIWKWIPASNGAAGQWAFYAPGMSDITLASFAAQRGYSVLTTIEPGEGFWINASQSTTLQVLGGAGVNFNTNRVMPSWNLLATGVEVTPALLNTAMGSETLDNFTSLWAWDSAQLRWYFYAPRLVREGTLGSYAAENGYLDFISDNKRLGHGVGFWVNR
jgi:subtilisin family serine protease